MDYLSLRHTIIGLGALELLAIVILLPSFYANYLLSAIFQDSQRHDPAAAVRHLKILATVFGCEPGNGPKGLVARFLDIYLNRDPQWLQRYYGEGASDLVVLDKYDEAEQLLKKFDPAVLTHPMYNWKNSHVPVLWGLIYEKKGEHEKALGYFRQALQAVPTEPTACFYVGSALFEQGHYLEAGFYLRNCLTEEKYSEKARQMMAQIEKGIFNGGQAPAEAPRPS